MGLGDGRVMGWDLQSGNVSQIGQVNGGVSCCSYIGQLQMLVVGDYDQKITFYQLNQNN